MIHMVVKGMLLCAASVACMQAASIKPNPVISRGTGAEVNVSKGEGRGLNDNKFGQYATQKWAVSDGVWAALKVVDGTYSRVFVIWGCPDTSWSNVVGVPADSCSKKVEYPVDYELLTSSNSTTGEDGDWTSAVTVAANNVAGRGHLIEFTGAKWVKMKIGKGSGFIDEIEVFDASNGAEDTWFFLGTQLTALSMKGAMASGWTSRDKNVPDSNFAAMITRRNPGYNPAVIRGGINCRLKTGDVVRDISKYLEAVGNVHFWAIEIGTFDAWGGKADSAAVFKKNLKTIIDSCLAHHIQPVIARIPSTDPAVVKPSFQINKAFLDAMDDLVKTGNLTPGPDLYAYFTTPTYGPLDLDKGYLPNQYGNFEMQREWNLKMDTVVYKAAPVSVNRSLPVRREPDALFSVQVTPGTFSFSSDGPGVMTLFTLDGTVANEMSFTAGRVHQRLPSLPGYYLLQMRTAAIKRTVSLMVN